MRKNESNKKNSEKNFMVNYIEIFSNVKVESVTIEVLWDF